MHSHNLSNAVARLWRTDRPLTATALLMLALLAIAIAGLWLDPRTIGGAPAWLKPAKFAMSVAIYCATLAWVFTYLPDSKLRRRIGWTNAVIFVGEVLLIDLQAVRGTTSHFNVSTPLDAAIFSLMGMGILIQTLSVAAVTIAAWRQPFEDRAFGWALRLGLAITLAGGATGALMTQPTAAQLAEMEAAARPSIVGAHTVGAPDGGEGLPGTTWSTTHGDLRVPHFFGLHAIQLLPVLLLLAAGRPLVTRVRLTLAAAASYSALFGILLWQALRGQSLVQPDGATLTALAIWGAVSAAAMAWAVLSRPTLVRPHALAG